MKPASGSLLRALTEEALRLFFPLCAIHAAIWPFIWTWLFGLDLPLRRTTPPSIWHGHEMLYGAYGAALLGFILTAVPEWTNTSRPSARLLLLLAGLWMAARLVGLVGADGLNLIAAMADIAWLGILIVWLGLIAVRRRAGVLTGFLICLSALLAWEIGLRFAIANQAFAQAQTFLEYALLTFCALLGLALMRITPPITNRVLDPTQFTAPFRPHPGRRYLSPAMVAVVIGPDLLGASTAVLGYLLIGAGAAFLDRVAESFIGRRFFRLEILALAGSAAFAGIGLVLLGAGHLGPSQLQLVGLHVIAMGGLGFGVLGVFAIAGRLHTGQDLGLSRSVGLALTLALFAMALRAASGLGFMPPGPAHGWAALAWAAAFLIWLREYWPPFSTPSDQPVTSTPT